MVITTTDILTKFVLDGTSWELTYVKIAGIVL